MSIPDSNHVSRRSFLWKFMVVPAALALAACDSELWRELGGDSAAVPEPLVTTDAPIIINQIAPTPACGDDDDEETPAQTEGPYYTPNSPERASLLEPNMAGTVMILTGTVLTTDCQPVARALVDFWHADDAGVYDNVGYRLRGHQFTDDQGRYTLETVVPGLYPGPTRHFHVKVQAPNQPILTTQLYFPDEPSNSSDGIYSPALLMAVEDVDAGKRAAFDFVLTTA